MSKNILFFMVLFLSAALLVNTAKTCVAADNATQQEVSLNELTADDQSESEQDREITQKIRRAIVTDRSLSIYAHNVKIITVGGMVTLKGPVKTEEEKRAIEEKAAEIAGSGNVTNEIDVVPN